MKKIFILILILLFPLKIFCINIATSIYPLADIIKNISPDNYNIFCTIPPNANPHIFEPTPKIAVQLKKADIFIGIERDFDGWIEKFLSKKCNKVYLLNKKLNPHIWLSPAIMIEKIKFLNKILCKLDKQQCNIITVKSENYLKKLINEHSKLQKRIEKIKFKNIIQYHPAWNYFAKDFGLNIVGTISKEHGANISLKHYLRLINIAKRKNVKIIVVGLKGHNNTVKNFAKSISGKVVTLELFGNEKINYLHLIKNNVVKIVNALKEY